MNNHAKGWMLFIAAIGMYATMVSTDIGQLEAWKSAWEPAFVAKLIGYFGAVVGAFVGGTLVPPMFTEKKDQ